MTRTDLRVALIEDDADIAFTVRLNLEREGYSVTTFNNGHEGLLGVQQGGFDFLILDLNLPDLDGFTICRELRRDPATKSLPILMLTARISEADRIMGLELGADDYLVKPFSVRELLARIAAILRRAKGSESDSSVYDDGQLRIDGRTLRVYVEGDEVKLAKKELELLWMLVRNRPAVVSRDRILSEVWQVAEDVETRTVDAHIRNLRKQIGKDRIKTVIGYGYRFEEECIPSASSSTSRWSSPGRWRGGSARRCITPESRRRLRSSSPSSLSWRFSSPGRAFFSGPSAAPAISKS